MQKFLLLSCSPSLLTMSKFYGRNCLNRMKDQVVTIQWLVHVADPCFGRVLPPSSWLSSTVRTNTTVQRLWHSLPALLLQRARTWSDLLSDWRRRKSMLMSSCLENTYASFINFFQTLFPIWFYSQLPSYAFFLTCLLIDQYVLLTQEDNADKLSLFVSVLNGKEDKDSATK